jgi:hypothetical protein
MVNTCQLQRLLVNLVALGSLLDNRIHRSHQDCPNDESIRRLYEQRLEVHRFSALVMGFVSSQLNDGLASDDESPLVVLQRSPLASDCWNIFSEHMPLSAYILAGDCGCDVRDGVVPGQLMLPL